jgi:hypothetical protein
MAITQDFGADEVTFERPELCCPSQQSLSQRQGSNGLWQNVRRCDSEFEEVRAEAPEMTQSAEIRGAHGSGRQPK